MIDRQPSEGIDEGLVTEKQAVARLKQGDIRGLGALVQQHQAKAVQAALLIVRDRALAEEIVQDAFLRAFQRIQQFDESRAFSPWFLRSVIHAALKVASQQQKWVPLEEHSDGSEAPTAAWLIDARGSPEDLLETDELREQVWRALEQLTPDQRAAVVLRYFLDQNEAEMIQELDRPLTTIKWWLYAARKRLRSLLSPLFVEDTEPQEGSHDG